MGDIMIDDKDIDYWFTCNGNKIPVKKGETPHDAWKRHCADVLNLSTEELKKQQTIKLTGKKYYIQLPKDEYAQLCSEIRTRYANKIPKQGAIKIDGMCYIFTYNRRKELILCIQKISIVGNESKIKEVEKFYE